MDDKKYYEEQEKNLSARSAAFVQYLTRRGYLSAPKVENEEAEKRRRELAKKAYHNTELLLESYRDIVWALECMPGQIANELLMPLATLDELIDRIDIELTIGNGKLEGRLNSISQSRLLVERLNEAVSVLKSKPKEGKDLYAVIYYTYMSPNEIETTWELFRILALSKRKYYDLRKKAIKLISLWLWSAPNQEIDMWLDVLTMLDKGND